MTDVELIKSKIDIVAFISDYVNLKKAGRNFKGLCPFHSEKSPSFIVSPERQSWHCFGACAMGGDAITFYEKWEGIDFLEALKALAERTGITLQKYTPTSEVLLKEKLYAVNNLAADFFHFLLTEHPIGEKARNYLKDRKIRKETAANFRLGYSPESWDSLNKFLLKKGFSQSDIYSSGLVIRSDRGSYYDRFRGRLMFTLHDHRGKCAGFSGRKLPPQPEAEAKYINSPETPVYIKGNILYGLDKTREFIKKSQQAVIVEGEFDFLASFQSGVSNVVAIKGSALTENQTLLLKRFTENILLALDADFAGNEAAKRGIEIAENAGMMVKVVKLLQGKDPAECVAKGEHFWKKSVEKAVPIYDFVIEQAFAKYNPQEVNGKRKISEEIIPFLVKIRNSIVLSHYIKKCARDLDVTEESIEMAIENFNKTKNRPKIKAEVKNEVKNRQELLEEHFLALLLQSDKIHESLEKVETIISRDDFRQNAVSTILKLLEKQYHDKKKLKIEDLNMNISPEIAPVFDLAYMSDLGNFSKDAVLLEKELIKTAKLIRKMSLRGIVNDLSTKMKDLEKAGKTGEIEKLGNQVRQNLLLLKELEN
ncbi:MAG: primase, DNA primase protein [Candidatus Gottesmanbacteria bacterium GW2011_GWA2_43_14]|uniref:DNA primase n=1 Tax=Candidatus Gottesmanbacteria bacterium GW2011_GWA2_43_14 TaxID=1618443 RepID=A0A0G1DFE2_9BACT|nr:MAG: primase, DNA primase protein [Candidatus Gottesmanbacteria bacterium GW2011_GWA2_43_14]